MRRAPRRPVLVSVVLAASLAAGLVGCGDDGDSAGAADCVVVAPIDGVTPLEVTGKNLAFDVECFEIQPGPVELTFHNEDSSVSHNMHVTGTGVNEATSLERGKVTQVLELELTEPGRYDFVCDPHPTMEGSIYVADTTAGAGTTTSSG